MKISANKFVAVTYDLYVGEGEERELMEKATREVPLKFIYGTGSMIQAFEDALMGLESGAALRLLRKTLMANTTKTMYWICRRISLK